jgi:hypothetical protein
VANRKAFVRQLQPPTGAYFALIAKAFPESQLTKLQMTVSFSNGFGDGLVAG